MAKFNYDKTLATARRLLEKFGNPVSLTRDADPSLWEQKYDPVTEDMLWVNKNTGAEQSQEPPDTIYIKDGVFIGISEEQLADNIVRASDRTLLIEGIPEPKIGDVFLSHNGIQYSYVSHKEVNPAGTSLLYKIVVRV